MLLLFRRLDFWTSSSLSLQKFGPLDCKKLGRPDFSCMVESFVTEDDHHNATEVTP